MLKFWRYTDYFAVFANHHIFKTVSEEYEIQKWNRIKGGNRGGKKESKGGRKTKKVGWSEKDGINGEDRTQMNKKGREVSEDGEKTYPQHYTQWNKACKFSDFETRLVGFISKFHYFVTKTRWEFI